MALERVALLLPAPPTAPSGREGQGPPVGGGVTFTVHPSPNAPLEVAFGREKTILLNPYTGERLGDQARGTRDFFAATEKIHRALGGTLRNSFGRSLVGACNLIFLFLVVSGFYLWMPKKWTAKYLRPALWFRGGLSGRARNWNWHNTIGFWSAVPLFFIVLSGVIMSYAWANNLLYQVTGTQPPAPGARPAESAAAPRARRGPRPETADVQPRPLADLLTAVQGQNPDWRTISFQMPREGSPTVTFTVDSGSGGQPQKRWTKTIDRSTAALVRQEGFESLNAGRRLRTIARFLHTGEILGLFGQVVAALASLGGCVLVWTGLALAIHRFSRWLNRRRTPSSQQPSREQVPVGSSHLT